MVGIWMVMACAGLAIFFLLAHQFVWAIVLGGVALLLAVGTGWRFVRRGDDL